MLNTFFREMITQSNTDFSLGILLIVFRGLEREKEKEIKVFSNLFTKYLRTLSSLIAFSLWPVEVLLKRIFLQTEQILFVKTLILAIKIPMDIHRG